MIIFDLNCNNGHRFEGWFASGVEFERQVALGQVCCPQCNSAEVLRVPSPLHLGSADNKPKAKRARVPAAPVPSALTVYHQMVTEIMAQSEDTGSNFAREARRIHYHEAPARAIHGKSSDREFESLREEGIEVWRLPVLEKDKMN